MDKAKNDGLRVVVFKDGDTFVAQCLEHDICAQAPDLKTLRHRMDATIDAERDHARGAGKSLAESVGPAPDRYVAMWEKAWGSQDDSTDVRLALCA